ncbi:MAG TPA: tetratricopeptide repeat protein [Blastocatellia bacterium]|nr:tetratricopeptide repeat protein [Blastocatellia bacterium]
MKVTINSFWLLTILLALSVVAHAQAVDARLAAKFREATEAQRAGRFDEAAAAYAEVIRLRPALAEAYVNFGLVRQEQKQYDEAVKLFEKAIALKPQLAGAHLFLGIARYSLGQTEPAIVALDEAVRLLPKDARALMWLGVAHLAAGHAAEAAKHLDAAATLQPADVDILYHRGRAHLKLSQESYEQMYKADPKSARVHQVLAQSYEESGRDAEAIAEYEAAIRIAPNLPGVRDALGSLYWKNNRMDDAERMFEEELKLDPHNALVMYKAGGMRVERGQPERGLPLLEAAIRQSPDLIDAYYYLGKAQGLLGQNDAAIANLTKVVAGNPTGQLKESAYYQLSRVYRKVGRQAEAQQALLAFQKLKDEREQQKSDKLEEIKKRMPN